MTQTFIDFINTCDWCGKYVGFENLNDFYDKEHDETYYFCDDCMEEVRRIRRKRREKCESD